MDLTDAGEHEVLDAVFTFIDDWEEHPSEASEPSRHDAPLTGSLTPFAGDGCAEREKPRRELRRLREEAPALESRLKRLRSARARYEAANCEASRVIARAASELRRGRPEAVNVQLLLVWKDMAKKHERLRKDAEEENRILREHLALQLRTIAALQKMKSTPRPRQISLRLLLPRSNTISGTGARNTLDNLSSFLVSQFSETDQVFRLGNMPSTLSEESSEMVSSTQMHLEVLYSNHLPFHFQAAARALWKNCRNCHNSFSVDPDTVRYAGKYNSFVSSYESDELSFAMNGHSTMRMHDASTRNVIVSSSKYRLLLDNNGSGSHYSDKGWVAIEPAHDDATELCILRICARIELNVDCHLSDGDRYLDLLSGFLLEQKRQEVDVIRLGIENDLLAAPSWQVSL